MSKRGRSPARRRADLEESLLAASDRRDWDECNRIQAALERESGDPETRSSQADRELAVSARRPRFTERRVRLAAALERILRDLIRDLRDCGGELFGTDELADELEEKLRAAQIRDVDPGDEEAVATGETLVKDKENPAS